MPQLSDTMHDGTLLKWVKDEGALVKKGDVIAEVGTDKADLEIESYHDGYLLKHYAQVGEKIPVGQQIAVIGDKNEAVDNVNAGVIKNPQKQISETTELSDQPINNAQVTPITPLVNRIKISPLAKALATQHNIDYSQVAGSGDGQRIVKQDIENLILRKQNTTQHTSSPTTASQSSTVSPLSSMRQTIAYRMQESKTTIPHFYMTTRINAVSILQSQKALKELPSYKGVTITHFIIKAVSLCLRDFPQINNSYANDKLTGNSITQNKNINIGIVTTVEDGLLVPVIKNADSMPFTTLVSESNALIQRAKSGKPQPNDLLGATFSLSNIGRYDIESFYAIIAPGQSAILAVSPINDEPIVSDGQVVPGKILRLSLSADHRTIDGLLGASFLTKLKYYLETPILCLAA